MFTTPPADSPLSMVKWTETDWVPTDSETYWNSPQKGALPLSPPPIQGDYMLIAQVPGIGARSMTLRGSWEQVLMDLEFFIKRAMERPLSGGRRENIPAWKWSVRVFVK